MADAPELILRRTLAQMLDDAALAVYAPTGPIPDRGIRLDGIMPTIDNFTMLTSLSSVDEGRANRIHRVQLFTRRKGGRNLVEQWGSDARDLLHEKEYTPNVLGISWAWLFSSEIFDPDSAGRSSIASTFYFRGRR